MEQASQRALTRIVWALVRFPELWILMVPFGYVTLAVASPLLRAHGYDQAGLLAFQAFRGFCHQMPSRSLFVEGFQMGVCARCFALAAGLLAGGIVLGRIADMEGHEHGVEKPRRIRVPFLAVIAAAIPMLLDGGTQLARIRESTNTLRVITGILLGATVMAWIVPTLYDAFDDQRRSAGL